MIQIYVTLIKKGIRTLEQVPVSLRTDVQAALDSDVV